MHFPAVLEKYGCTQARLRQIFTATDTKAQPVPPAETAIDLDKRETPPKSDGDIRQRFESRIRSRILDGVANNARAARPMQAVDMAWDTAPIQKDAIPLMLWAQGKIDVQRLQSCLTKSQGPTAQTFFQKQSDNTIKVNLPRICEIQVDLLHSYVTRRHAALNGLWSNLWPLYRYDPRGTDDISLLRADALTQRIDIMADDYNYRHNDSQARRYMLLYGYSLSFPRGAWDKVTSWRPKKTNTGEPTDDDFESYVVREGVDFVNPHPSRTFFDLSSPISNINTDTGPAWIGYWDVQRWDDLKNGDNGYFNLDKIVVSDGWIELASKNSDFFNYYFDPKVLQWPSADGQSPTFWNTRDARVGFYTSEARDMGVLRTQYFEKINPKREGIGNYDCDVWLRLSVVGDCTVVGAEFMPSIPAAYGAINCNDDRVENQSMAMSLLGYQDQASNIISHMLQQLRSSLVQLWLLDKDSLEPEIIEDFKKNADNKDWWVDPKLLIYSATKLRELGIQDPRQAFGIVQNNITGVIESGLKALAQLLNLADRLLILSPNEQGQPNPREVAAREVQEISTSVQSVYSFISEGPREQIMAKKKLIYESLVCCGSQTFRVPVEKSYAKDVLEKAGFSVAPDVVVSADDILPIKTPVMGNLRDLIYDYYFDSRDGSERVVNTQGAQVIMQLAGFLFKIPGMPQAMGTKTVYEMCNLVIRMSGAPWNFQFQAPVGGPQTNLPPEAGAVDMQKVMQTIEQLSMRLQRTDQILATKLGVPLQVIEGTGQPQPGAPAGASAVTPHPAGPNGSAPTAAAPQPAQPGPPTQRPQPQPVPAAQRMLNEPAQ